MLIKRGRIWHYQTRINGKTFRRSTRHTNRQLAEAAARQFQTEARLRRQRSDESLNLSQCSLREIARIETDISPGLAERATSAFKVFLDWLGHDPAIHTLTPDIIEDNQRARLRDKARDTVDKETYLILRMLRNNGIHIPKPSPKPGRRTDTRNFTDDEIARFFAHATHRLRPLWATLYATGARLAELLPSHRSRHKPLLKTEVDFERALIHIRQAKARGHSGARARPRPPVPVNAQILTLLRRQIDATPAGHPYVFENISNPGSHFRATLERADIPLRDPLDRILRIHSFRHHWITKQALTLKTPWLVKEAIGHASINTTELYIQPAVHILDAIQVPLADLADPIDDDTLTSAAIRDIKGA